MARSLWQQVTMWENLLIAFRKASKGKRGLPAAAIFEHHLTDKLHQLQNDLITHTYRPGRYTHFYVHEPKRRKISAAPFRDRVVHHALCNRIEPIFERLFLPQSFANRRRKGTHRAIDQLQAYAYRYKYVLRADIVKHFPSLDHAILRAELGTHIHDQDVLRLMDVILASGKDVLADEYEMVYFPGDDLFAVERARGLPIGNLTSQFWSNVYMNPFDWFVKRELRCTAYLRYVDDFALFSNSKKELYQWKQALIQRLARMRLTIHETESQVIPCHTGIPWLGFVVYPDHRLVKARKVVNFTRHYTYLIREYEQGRIPMNRIRDSVMGWINHVRYGDTDGLRTALMGKHVIHIPRTDDQDEALDETP